jgi:hypothetical protein
MKSQLTAFVAGGAFVMMGGAALGHHSFAMFDAAHPIELTGTVKEFRFVSPHTILIVNVTGQDGVNKEWILEGGAPGMLVRDGMRANSLRPGDEIMVGSIPCMAPRRSFPEQVKFRTAGQPQLRARV